jgi:hypothetical protein
MMQPGSSRATESDRLRAAQRGPEQTERRALWHSLITMLLILCVAFVPAVVSMWRTLDCDRASDVCRSSARFLGIAISTSTFPASSLRRTRLADLPSHDRGPVRHHWDIVLVAADGEYPMWVDASSEQDEELRRELRGIASFMSGTTPSYEYVSVNGLNLIGLLFLLPVGWAAVRACQLILRIWRSG